MTVEILVVLAILLLAVVSFALDRVPADVTALGVMLSLVFTGVLPPERAFAGFGSHTVMMILGLLIMTAALQRSGVVEVAGRELIRRAGAHPERLLLIVIIAVAVVSTFMSNTAATAFFLPVVFGVASKLGQSPSRYLLPLAFASILTSSVTLISTSTNLVVSELLTQYGLGPMGMFELAPVGIPITIVGLIYIWTAGIRLMPNTDGDAGPQKDYGLRPYLTEVLVLEGSPLVGKTLAESGIGRDMDLTIVRVLRKGTYISPRRNTKLSAGDVLLLEGYRENILKVKEISGIEIKADATLSSPHVENEPTIVEAVLLPGSPLLDRTLESISFRQRYDLQVLAINRAGATLIRKLSDIRLRLGDVLLVQGDPGSIRALDEGRLLSILTAVDLPRRDSRKAKTALAIFLGAMLLGTFEVMPFSVACLAGAVVSFVTRTIAPEEAYREVEWKALILIGSMLSLGAAMQETGTERYLADLFLSFVGSPSPYLLLSVFFILTLLLTQPMSNQAAAVVIVPIAIQTAVRLGLPPRPLVLMVAVAASCSYLTPLEPSCLMVYGPGKYRFRDFFIVGLPLTFVIFAIALLLVPFFWPFQ